MRLISNFKRNIAFCSNINLMNELTPGGYKFVFPTYKQQLNKNLCY